MYTYIKKAAPSPPTPEEIPQEEAVAAPPPEAPPPEAPPPEAPPVPGEAPPAAPEVNPYDMNSYETIVQLMTNIDVLDDNAIAAIAVEIWGDGYEYVPISLNHVRSEISGFMMDQIDLLEVVPGIALQGAPLPNPAELEHTSPSLGPDSTENLASEEKGFQDERL